MRLGLCCGFCLAYGCTQTSQRSTELPLDVAGTAVEGEILAVGGVPVTVERAELAFGPLVLCAGAQAGELCETARLEWLSSVVVDVLDPDPQPAGMLRGLTGDVRSYMYDLGISSQLTVDEPQPLSAAEALEGNSLVLSGHAEVEDMRLPFLLQLAVAQETAAERGVPVVRSSQSDALGATVGKRTEGLRVTFDAQPWLEAIDFREFVENRTCSVGEQGPVCAGTLEQRCDGEGGVVAERDCPAEGLVCVAAEGCVAALRIDEESTAHRTLRNALVAGERPRFSWD